MVTICDICKEKISMDVNTIDVNGEMDLCSDCLVSAGEFIRSKEMKAYTEKAEEDLF